MGLAIPSDIVPIPDLEQVRRALDLLIPAGGTFEVRGLPSRRSYVGRDIDAAVEFVRGLAGDHGIYWTMNPLRGGLAKAATDADVLHRRWLMVDVDPIRPKEDGCATEAERLAAAEVGWAIRRDLAEANWPDPLVIDTGNGMQLLYRVELPNTEQSRQWVRSVLTTLAERYSTDGAKVDTSVHNASRISRLPGTWNRKGASTKSRPHRLCQLAHTPDRLDPVPVAAIRDLIGTPKPEPQPAAAGGGLNVPTILPEDGDATWYRKALENEAAKVCLAPVGDRHTQLITSARTLAGYLHHGAYTEAELRQTLATAAERAGLPSQESAEAIHWAVAKGKEQPLGRHDKLNAKPAKGGDGASAADAQPLPDRLIIGADEIDPKTVQWRWPLRIARGFISLFGGQTGQGKSFVTCDLAARFSQGTALPDHPGDGEVLGTLFISEDPYEYVLVPRLTEAGADLSRIKFMTWEAMAAYTLARTDMLTKAWEQAGSPALLVIDPPTNFLSAKDEHKNSEVRQVLMKLVGWLQERDVACVLITHLNKPGAKGSDALSRIIGSVAWATTCRIACIFYPDPDDPARSLVASPKNNIGPRAKTLAYRIATTDTFAKVEWLGEVDITAEQANSGEKRQPKRVQAVDWLTDRFREQRVWSSVELYRDGAEVGLKKDTIFEAKQSLPISARKNTTQDGRQFWEWLAQEGWPSET